MLANTSLDNLRFMKQVEPGGSIVVVLAVKQKTRRNADPIEVRWFMCLTNQVDDVVAEYELLTMVAL